MTAVLEPTAPGPAGPDGPAGPPGAPGPPGPDVTYTHNQGTPASVWNVTHNLGKHPSVSVVDSAGTSFLARVVYLDNDNLDIYVTPPFGGFAFLN